MSEFTTEQILKYVEGTLEDIEDLEEIVSRVKENLVIMRGLARGNRPTAHDRKRIETALAGCNRTTADFLDFKRKSGLSYAKIMLAVDGDLELNRKFESIFG